MKTVLLIGATLMVGASIYGVVDYKKTQNKQEFKTMYQEPEVSIDEPPVTETKKTELEAAEVKKVTPIKKEVASTKKHYKKKAKKKRIIKAEFFSRGGLDERFIEPMEEVPAPKEEKKKN